MDAEEWAISRSSPGARFDAPTPGAATSAAAAAATPAPTPVDEPALRWFEAAVRDPRQPVVAFTLAWCEFSWSLRKLFEHIGLPYRAVDLDAPALRQAGLDLPLRALLHIRTGQPTLPQVFIGGQHLGGCTETMAAFRSGELARRVTAAGLDAGAWPALEPEQFLPRWRQRRETVA
ncbi:glutaredoxin domain-containing protein [Arenimonas fontis]|nr:glutaredoxin domain-containing protein [Arenimonas fontis]